jgi:hypothetical protein
VVHADVRRLPFVRPATGVYGKLAGSRLKISQPGPDSAFSKNGQPSTSRRKARVAGGSSE